MFFDQAWLEQATHLARRKMDSQGIDNKGLEGTAIDNRVIDNRAIETLLANGIGYRAAGRKRFTLAPKR